MELLKKYISSDVQEETVKDVIDKIVNLKKVSENLNSLIKETKISLTPKTFHPFYDFLYTYYKIYGSVDKYDFLEELKATAADIEITFWNSIIGYFDFVKIVEEQTSFLREMNTIDFQDLISYTFNNNILHNSIIEPYKKWDIEKINITRRTINTFLSCMINDFDNFDSVIYDLNLRFQFDEEKYKYIWNLCEQNKMYLMIKNITEKLNNLYYANEHKE